MADPITMAAESMWVSGPLRVQRRYSSTRGIVGDGHMVALLPPLAVVSMVVVAVGYFGVGLFGLGFVDIYSESLFLMGSLVALGALSGQLGLIGLVSFAVGDFLFGHRQWTFDGRYGTVVEEVIRARVPLIISYLLLGVAVLFIPRLGKNIVLGIGQWRRIPPDLAWLITTPAVILVSWLGLRTWAALSPTLIRPFFVWAGGVPTREAIEVFQGETSQLVAYGVAATVARQFVTALFIYVPWFEERLAALEARGHVRIAGDGPPAPPRAPTTTSRFVGDLFGALLATLVLSGILETRGLWFTFFAAFLVIRFLRSGTVRLPPVERWKQLANRVPVVVRLGLTWLAAVLYRSLLSNDVIGSYRTMAIIVLVGVVLGFLIFPGRPRPATAGENVGGLPPADREQS